MVTLAGERPYSRTDSHCFSYLDLNRASGGAMVEFSNPADWESWSPFNRGTEPAPPPVSDVASPRHGSIWSAV